jgi:hypothetical protein
MSSRPDFDDTSMSPQPSTCCLDLSQNGRTTPTPRLEGNRFDDANVMM